MEPVHTSNKGGSITYPVMSCCLFDRRTRPDEAVDVPPSLSPLFEATFLGRPRVFPPFVLLCFDSSSGTSALRFRPRLTGTSTATFDGGFNDFVFSASPASLLAPEPAVRTPAVSSEPALWKSSSQGNSSSATDASDASVSRVRLFFSRDLSSAGCADLKISRQFSSKATLSPCPGSTIWIATSWSLSSAGVFQTTPWNEATSGFNEVRREGWAWRGFVAASAPWVRTGCFTLGSSS